jgi:hypothetical protein
MVDAVAAARSTAEKMRDMRSKVMANPMATALSNQRTVQDTAGKLLPSATLQLDAALVAGRRVVAEAAALAPEAPRDAKDVLLAGEIRQKLASMSPAERGRMIENDDRVASAAFNAPPMLSGLGEAEQEALRDRWRRKRYPAQVARAERLQRAMPDVEQAGEVLLSCFGSLTDSRALAEATERERAAQDAISR